MDATHARRALGAVLFLQAAMTGIDVFSAVNSSPWTAESFGGDPAKEASLREYVHHGIVLSAGLAVASSMIAGSWWPIVGVVAADSYMWWLYQRAILRAQCSGSEDWSDQ